MPGPRLGLIELEDRRKNMIRTSPILKTAAMFLALIAIGAFSYGADLRIVVKVRSANVRLKPAMDSPVVGNAQLGLILDVQEKLGDWYSVELSPDAKGMAVRGYIHKSVVQEMNDQARSSNIESVVATKPSGKVPVVTPARAKKAEDCSRRESRSKSPVT